MLSLEPMDGVVEDLQRHRLSIETKSIPPSSRHAAPKRTRPMRVLNLGLFRTGTSSLREALKTLGFQNVYHMDYVFSQKPSDSTFWLRAYDAKYRSKRAPLTRDDWDEVLGDCDAVSDFPCAAFSEELIAAYPEAKVILTIRDSTASWFDSALRTVWFVHQQSPFARGKFLGRPMFDALLPDLFRMGKRMFGDVFDGDLPRTGVAVYEEHNELIRRIVPKERLLVFNVKEGWAPLCEFLGLEVSAEMEKRGFPHVNEGQAFVDKVLGKQAMMRRKIREMFVAVVVGLLALVILLFRLW